MSSTTPIIIVVAVIGAFIVMLTLVCALSSSANDNSTSKYYGPFGHALDGSIQNAAQLRLQQESYTENGEPVWFSHQMEHGRLKHWVLIAHDLKYEIRRFRPQQRPSDNSNSVDLESGCVSADGWVRVGSGAALYEYRTRPSKIDNERVMAAVARYAESQTADAFTSSLIGWTKLSEHEVEAAWVAMLERFGPYDILWNNCQHFLRNFATSIIQEKAEDWGFFQLKTSTNYQRSRHGGHFSHVASTAASLERMKQMRPHVQDVQKRNLEENIKAVEKHLRQQKVRWGQSLPIDLADASDNFSLSASSEGAEFDSSLIILSFGDLGGDLGDSGCGGDGGGGDSGGDGGGGDGGGGGD